MSIDIIFQKPFTIGDIKNKTDIEVLFIDGSFRLYKNGSYIYVKILESYDLEDDEELVLDYGYTVYGLTQYGMNTLSEILPEIVLTLQTKFMTDEEEEMLIRDETLDSDVLFDEVTKKFGFTIIDGVIYN